MSLISHFRRHIKEINYFFIFVSYSKISEHPRIDLARPGTEAVRSKPQLNFRGKNAPLRYALYWGSNLLKQNNNVKDPRLAVARPGTEAVIRIILN